MKIYTFLKMHDIDYERVDHPPVYTVDDVNRLTPDLPAAKTKNLFLRDKKGKNHYLVIVGDDKRVDLKSLSKAMGVSNISFGSSDRLMQFLGIEPGSVSLLAIINDPEAWVQVYMDQQLWQADKFAFHPLINTSTLLIKKADIIRFVELTGHALNIIDVPETNAV